jgi:TonB family protein
MHIKTLWACAALAAILLPACSTTPQPIAAHPVAATSSEVVRWDETADAPAAAVSKTPVYPFEAWRSRTEGSVRMVFCTDADGHVTGIRCLESTDERFCAAATKALAQWRFSQKQAGPFRLLMRFTVSDAGASISWK